MQTIYDWVTVAIFALPKLQPAKPAVVITQWLLAPVVLGQRRDTWPSPAVAVAAGAAVGPPAQPLLTGAGVEHALLWRLHAL